MERNRRERERLARDITDYETEQNEGMVSDFDQTALKMNCVDFYNTVYVTSDQISDYSHPDSDVEFHTPLRHTPLRLHRRLTMSNSDVYFSDDV